MERVAGRPPTQASRTALSALMLSTSVDPACAKWQQVAASYRFARNMANANKGSRFETRYLTRMANIEAQVGTNSLPDFLRLVDASPKRELYVHNKSTKAK